MKRLVLLIGLISFASAFALAQEQYSSAPATDSAAVSFSWKRNKMDGHRTGVTAPTGSNIKEAMGVYDGKQYVAPNGKVFKKGSTPEVARIMFEAQEVMAPVKEVIGRSAKEMDRYRPQCELSNWFTGFLIEKTAELTDRHVDVAIYNFGGIRTDMPAGDLTVDDIYSMFPFNNSLCYLCLKGSDLRYIFEYLAKTRIQAFSGAKIVVKDHKLQSITINGKPLDDRKFYGVATINFLLDGGDGLFLAKNAKEFIDSGVYVKDALVPYIREMSKENKVVDGELDDRVTIIGDIKDYR